MLCLMQTLNDRLRIAREAAKLSQTALSKLVGVTSQTVNQWETGYVGSGHKPKSPSRQNLFKVAQITAVSVDWLLYGGNQPEQDSSGRFIAPGSRGRSVPMLSIKGAIAGERPLPNAQMVNAFFPCGENSYYFILPDKSNAPEHPEGSVWIMDPDLPPTPGRMVLGASGAKRQPVFGEVSYQTTPTGQITVIAPLAKGWPHARSDLEPVEIIAVMTESIRPGR